MTYTHKLSRRLAMLRRGGWLLLAALALGCDVNDPEAAGTSPLDFKSAGNGAKLVLRPEHAAVEVEQPIQFIPYASDGKRALDPTSVEWTVSGGRMTQSGLFTADSTGNFKVTARVLRGRERSDTSMVDVMPAQPGLAAVVVSPASVTLAPGAETSFTVEGLLADSTRLEIGAEWSATGGTIDAGGVYLADSVPGTYRVVAHNSSSGLADTAVVTIEGDAAPAVTLTAVVLTPTSVSLTPGQTKQFAAAGKMSDGSTTALAVTFRATGGSIDSTGLYTAGTTAGGYKVIAAADGLADTASVTISVLSTTSCSAGPLALCPGDNLQGKLNAAGTGATLTVGPGVYRHASVAPLERQTLRFQRGAVWTGAKVLTDFVSSGSIYAVGGQTQQNSVYDARTCVDGGNVCNLPEQLWVDSTFYQRKATRAEVAAGSRTWAFDYSKDSIYIGTDPTGHVVETSVTPYAIGGTAPGVRIIGDAGSTPLPALLRYATGPGHGVIGYTQSAGWTVDGMEIGHSHGTCVRASDKGGLTIRNSFLHHCGAQGAGGRAGSGLLVYGNELAWNNTAGFAAGGGDAAFAGMKFSGAVNPVIRRNRVHHNNAIGIWCDLSCVNATVDSNEVTDNARRGIQWEISYGCRIIYNTVARNATTESGSTAAGIWIAQSSDCEVAYNEVLDNPVGIMATDRDRGSGTMGTYELTDLYVHHNRVRQRSGTAGGVQDQSTARDPYSTGANNRYTGNQYECGSSTKWQWQSGAVGRSTWQAEGNDTGGAFTGC